MKIAKLSLLILCLSISIFSCNEDDDTFVSIPVIPPRDRAEVQEEDNQEILDYLATHYYNSDAFGPSNSNPSIADLEILPLVEDETEPPAGKTILLEAIEEKNVVYEGVDYVIYVLDLNKNVSATAASPSFADNVTVKYEGFTLDNEVFYSVVTPDVLDLTILIAGWRKVLPSFKVSEFGPTENGDGTVSYTNHGVGVMFIPSGLGYFDFATTNIPSYSPIAFKFDLLSMSQNDHDEDGIPSYLEDIDNDGNLTTFDFLNADDDTDNDGEGDYRDADDDGDGVLTIDELEHKTYTINEGEEEPILADKEYEISRAEEARIITINTVTIVDSNNDGKDDYLDPSIKINYNN